MRGCRYMHAKKASSSAKYERAGNYLLTLEAIGQILPCDVKTPIGELSESTIMTEPIKVSNPNWVENAQRIKKFQINKNTQIAKVITAFDEADFTTFDYGKKDLKKGEDPPLNGRGKRETMPTSFNCFSNASLVNIIKSHSRETNKEIFIYRQMTTDARHAHNRMRHGNHPVVRFKVVSKEDLFEAGFVSKENGRVSTFVDWNNPDMYLKYRGNKHCIDCVTKLLLKINQISERDLDVNYSKASVEGIPNCTLPTKEYLILDGCVGYEDSVVRGRSSKKQRSDRERSRSPLNVVIPDESQSLFDD